VRLQFSAWVYAGYAGQRHLPGPYKAIGWLYPVLRVVIPNYVSTLEDVGRAMIRWW